jgi:hypothetical protein
LRSAAIYSAVTLLTFCWPEYMWTSELHGAVAHASQDQIIVKLKCAAGQGGGGHRYQIRNYELQIRKNENGSSVRLPVRDLSESSAEELEFISFCAETAHATASAISNDVSHIETFRPPRRAG